MCLSRMILLVVPTLSRMIPGLLITLWVSLKGKLSASTLLSNYCLADVRVVYKTRRDEST